MKYSILTLALVFLMAACDNTGTNEKKDKAELTKSISTLEAELFNSDESRIDTQKALDLVDLYTDFAYEFPDAPESPEYLFKAADISMNLKQPIETIHLFDYILEKYPDYEKTQTALFLKAFVYEDQLQDYGNAEKYYTEFLELYPNSDFADDAEVSLNNLGKTPEQLILEFEQSQK